MEKGKRVDTPRKMGKVYKNKQHKTGFPRAVLQSSPTRGMWIEILQRVPVQILALRHPPHGGCGLKYIDPLNGGVPRFVIPHTGDVD